MSKPGRCMAILAALFFLATLLAINVHTAANMAEQNHDFIFVSCEITESSFYTINLKGARYGKEYQMILDGDQYNNLCPKVKKGDLLNITYKEEKIQDEGDGDFFDAYTLVSYRMGTPHVAENVKDIRKSSDEEIMPKILGFLFFGWLIYLLLDRFMIKFRAVRLQMELNRELQCLYLNHGVGSDFEQNRLTEQFLENLMIHIPDKKHFRIFIAAIKMDNKFFTNEYNKNSFLEQATLYGKSNRLL